VQKNKWKHIIENQAVKKIKLLFLKINNKKPCKVLGGLKNRAIFAPL